MTMTNPIDLDLTAPVSASADVEAADIPTKTSQDSVRAFETALEGRPSGEEASLQEAFGAAMKSVAEGFSPETLKAVVDETLSLELPKPLMIESDTDTDAIPAVIAAPVAVPQQVEVAVQPVESADPSVRAGAVEAVSRVEKAVSAAETMVRAAEAVADAILVSPGLKAGDGEMLIRLRPDVLDGSTVRITVSGRQLGVEFMPVQMETAALIERNMSQLQQHLVARVHMYAVGVSVKKDRNGRV